MKVEKVEKLYFSVFLLMNNFALGLCLEEIINIAI